MSRWEQKLSLGRRVHKALTETSAAVDAAEAMADRLDAHAPLGAHLVGIADELRAAAAALQATHGHISDIAREECES